MSSAPMLPQGYQLDEPAASGPPKMPAGYVMDHAAEQQASEPPSPPSYLGEIAGGVGRAAKSLLYDFPKSVLQSAVPRNPTELGQAANPAGLIVKHMGQDLWQGVTQAGQASQRAKEQGEGAAGQTLAAAENYPVIGPMVRKAEEAGPGKFKLAPQTLGAVTEAALTFEGPQMLHGAATALHNVIPSLPRSGAAIGLIRDRIGAAPTGGTEGTGFTKANAEMNALASTGQPVPGPLKAFVEGVQAGAGKGVDINASIDELERLDPKLADKVRADIAAQDVLDKLKPPRPDSGIVDPTTFAGLTKFRTIFNAWKYERSLPDASRRALGAAADAMADEAQQIAHREGYGKEWQKYQAEYSSGKGAIRKAEKYGPVVGQGIGAVAGAIAPELMPGPTGYKVAAGFPGAYSGMKVGEKVGKLAEPVTKVIVNRPGTPSIRPLPPSPDAYMRTILAAKEGEIAPGEADRRIIKMGGKVKVKPIPRPPSEGELSAVSSAPSAESKVNDFLTQAFTRATQEAAGQEVLDRMTDAGESPIELNRHFWNETFNRLPPEVQNRFTRYLQKETGGMKPGDTIGVTKDKQPIVAKSWADIANNILELSHDPQELEGTTRGLITLMRIAEEKFPVTQSKARRIGPIPQPQD